MITDAPRSVAQAAHGSEILRQQRQPSSLSSMISTATALTITRGDAVARSQLSTWKRCPEFKLSADRAKKPLTPHCGAEMLVTAVCHASLFEPGAHATARREQGEGHPPRQQSNLLL